jgi:dTDP-4-dehydrorhamnose reductase
MNRIAVLGSTGQLGTDLVEALQTSKLFEVLPLDHAAVECTDLDSVRTIFNKLRPQVVVNCAAFVRVDECEDRPQKAFEVNALGGFHVARSCAEIDALCVYISTDYVFDGSKSSAYTESDTPSPINVYGVSKLAGEQLVRQAARRWLIVRMASLFGKAGARGKGGNFVETIIEKAKAGESLRVINDAWMSPTYSYDAAQALVRILQSNVTGLLHLTNQGSCTWYEFSGAILDFVGLAAKIEPVTAAHFSTRARRPRDSSLESERLDALLGHRTRSWQEALKAYLVEKEYMPCGT